MIFCFAVFIVKGSRKWETREIRKKANVRVWSLWRSRVICSFRLKFLFLFPHVTAKLISDYFDNKWCGSKKILLLIMRQFICAANLRSVKSDAARTRKKIREFTIHTANSVRIAIDVGKLRCVNFAGESGNGNKFLNGERLLKKMD